MVKKKSIGSRYSIEYAYPDASKDNKSNRKWPIFLLGVLALGGLSTVVIPFKSVETFIASNFNSNSKLVDTRSTTASAIEEQLSEETPEVGAIEITENTDPALIKKDKLAEVLDDLNSDFLIEASNSSAPNIYEVEVSEKEEVVEVIEVDVEKLLLDNQKQLEVSQEQLARNQELTDKLSLLSQQLIDEKERNEKLSAQISAQESNNSKLTTLLDEAIQNANDDDQKYIAELNALDNKQKIPKTVTQAAPKKETSKQTNSSNIAAINDQVAKLVATTLEPKKDKIIDHNNSISVSTASQVDAIILAMQDIQSTNLTSTNPRPKENIVKSSTAKSNDSLANSLFIDLQNQINSLLEPKKLEPKTQKTDNYKEALKKESKVRTNAMRSITVRKGETLWSIAVRAYGNGSFYKKIIEANPHITKDGKVVLSIGQIIRVPI